VNNQKEGKYSEIYKQNGKTKLEGNYVKGLKEGIWKYYNIKGSLVKEETYKNDLLNGPVTEYEQDKIQQIENYLNGEKDGISQKFVGNGYLSEKQTYKKGKLTARHSYYPDGELKSETIIPLDKNKTYQLKQYFKSGKIQVLSTLKNDECLKSIQYYETGQIETVHEVVDGEFKLTQKFSPTGEKLSVTCNC
jgi:antitoxin component YwqK of YwqJK toxin-antitoxin module